MYVSSLSRGASEAVPQCLSIYLSIYLHTHTHTHTHIHMYAYVCMLPRSQSNRGRTAKRLAEGFLVETARAALLPPFTDSPKISSASVSSPKSAPALLLLLLPRYRDRRQHTHNNDDADDDNNNTNTTNNNVSAKEAFEEARRSSVPLPRKFGAPESSGPRITFWLGGVCSVGQLSGGAAGIGSVGDVVGEGPGHLDPTIQSQGNHRAITRQPQSAGPRRTWQRHPWAARGQGHPGRNLPHRHPQRAPALPRWLF